MELPTRGILSGLGRSDEARKVVKRVLNVSSRVYLVFVSYEVGVCFVFGPRKVVWRLLAVVWRGEEMRLWLVWSLRGEIFGDMGVLDLVTLWIWIS